MPSDNALKVAREFFRHHAECECGSCEGLAALLTRYAAEAVEAARPEIERQARTALLVRIISGHCSHA